MSATARRRLAARAAAGARARRQRRVVLFCAALSSLVLILSGTAWGLTRYVNDTVGRVNAGTAGTPSSGPLNVLLAGVDLRSGLTPQQQRTLHVGHVVSSNSDTMMLVHVSANRRRVAVVSLPRDSWVDIPGHGMNKINAAFGLGGPRLMVATVQHLTGLKIDNFVEVNFLAFVTIVNALGGVNICLPFAVNDPDSGLRLSAGMHHVDGITALKYARDRHSFALSDLTRIKNQQSLLSSLLHEAISSGTLANPVKFSAFLRAVLGAVKVDRGLDVTALAKKLRGISMSDVRFLTVPLSTIDYRTPTGESAVRWDASAAKRIFAALKADQPVPSSSPAAHGHQGHSSGSHAAGHGASGAGAPGNAPGTSGSATKPTTTAGTRTAAQASCT